MAQNPFRETPPKPSARTGKARGGRPTRAEALRRRIEAVGIDPNLVDPLKVLAGIAIDESAPASARVAACRVLLAHSARFISIEPPQVEDADEPKPRDMLSERALQLLAGRGGLQ